MIELLKDLFQFALEAVIQSRERIKHHQRKTVNGKTGYFPDIAFRKRQIEQKNETYGRQDRTCKVGIAIESFSFIHSDAQTISRGI